jgi:hypothetical protein
MILENWQVIHITGEGLSGSVSSHEIDSFSGSPQKDFVPHVELVNRALPGKNPLSESLMV